MSSSISEHSLGMILVSLWNLVSSRGTQYLCRYCWWIKSSKCLLNMEVCEETASSLFGFYIIKKKKYYFIPGNFIAFLSENIIFKVFIYRPLSCSGRHINSQEVEFVENVRGTALLLSETNFLFHARDVVIPLCPSMCLSKDSELAGLFSEGQHSWRGFHFPVQKLYLATSWPVAWG